MDQYHSDAIIIRHAERNSIITSKDALDAELTERGLNDSFKFGKKLDKTKHIYIFHSPVLRCLQTVHQIANGAKFSNSNVNIIGPLDELGGPYIIGSWDTIFNLLTLYNQRIFIRKWFNNELSSDLLMSLNNAAHLQLNAIIKNLKNQALQVYVTHDWNIMILREYFFNLKHEEIGEPEFLDSIHIQHNGNSLIMKYHDHTQKFPIDFITLAD